jgi:hypothetical protein
MCHQCDALREKIAHYSSFLYYRLDPLTAGRIENLIKDIERELGGIHQTELLGLR